MQKRTDITDELKSISPTLASMQKVNVFQIPQDYFNDFDAKILTTVFLQDKKNNFQKVPDGYFNSLSNTILSKIKQEKNQTSAEEIKALSPALHYLKEEQVFDVPENYFANLSIEILKKINSPKPKVVDIYSVRKFWKYVAAAVVACGITISSLQIYNHNSSKNIPELKIASQYKTTEQFDKGIASLSDDEIAKYLEKNGNVMDEENISRNVDTTGLPSLEDYLIDENALNNYLNDVNAGSNKNTE